MSQIYYYNQFKFRKVNFLNPDTKKNKILCISHHNIFEYEYIFFITCYIFAKVELNRKQCGNF